MNAIRRLCVGVTVALALIGTGRMVRRVAAYGPGPDICPHDPLGPTNWITCVGQLAKFYASASGSPGPWIQWQASTNDVTFTNITGKVLGQLNFYPSTLLYNGNQYRAVFSNDCGSVTSAVATLILSLDSVGDGISDCWREQYFGSGTTTNNSSCATCDPDGDGLSNLQEFKAGTNPTNSLQFLVCPPTVVVNADMCSSVATNVNLGQPVMIGCDNPTISNNAPTSFSVGTNTVTWSAVCGSSFTTQCSQSVIVLPWLVYTNVPGIATNGIPFISVTTNQTYQYKASGCVLYWPNKSGTNIFSDPDGTKYTNSCSPSDFYEGPTTSNDLHQTCENLHIFSLVGKINGSCIQLGKTGSFTPSSPGTLTLYFNDDDYGDNSDSWCVCITTSQTTYAGISLVAPTNNQTFALNQNVILVANAYTSTGTITKVQFFDGANKIGQSTTAPYYYIWPGASIASGTHTLSAVASNSLGNAYTSNLADINVINGSISVTISSNLTLCTGASAIYTATATGTPTITYSWKQNGELLSGQTTNVLVLNDVTPWDAGTISVTATGPGGSATASATLTVGNTPIANGQSLTTSRGTALSITLTGSDPANASLTYTNVSSPMHGSLSSTTGSNLTYTPAGNFVGRDSFTFKVRNGTCDSDPATVSINVIDDFWVLFFDTLGCDESPPKLSLMITSTATATGTVSYLMNGVVSNQFFAVTPGSVTNVPIPASLMITNYGTVTSQGIHVTASQPISISALNYLAYASEAFAVFPTRTLGTDYCLLARPSSKPGRTCNDAGYQFDPSVLKSQFAILATESNTTVIVTPSPFAHIEGEDSITNFSKTLNRGETYQLGTIYDIDSMNSNDVTGSFISSDKPISVLAGARLALVPFSNGDVDEAAVSPLIEEQFPTNSWGTRVPVFPLATTRGSAYYRVVVAKNNTAVLTNGTLWTTLDKGESVDAVLREPVVFQGSNGPIQVAQFSGGDHFSLDGPLNQHTVCCAKWGSASELLMLPIGQYQNAYTLSVPTGFSTNFLNLIVEQYAIPTTQIDGEAILAGRFSAIGASGYSGAQIPVAPGTHLVNSSRPFGLQVYGYAYKNAYTYNAGASNPSNVTLYAVADVVSLPPGGSAIDVLTNDLFASRGDVVVTNVSNPSHGTVAITLSKTVSYTPTNGYFGDDHFTYQIMEQGQVSTAPVTVWITNLPPVAVDHSNVVVCSSWSETSYPRLTSGAVISVLEGAYSADGYSLSVESVGNPTNGVTLGIMAVTQSNTVTYWNYNKVDGVLINGADSFTYTVTDGRGGRASATVYLTVDEVTAWHPSQAVNVCGNQATTIGIPSGSTSSISGATLTFVSVSQGSFGSVSIVDGTTVTYTPGPGFSGSDEFSYTITDGHCTGSSTIPVSAYNPCTNLVLYGDVNCHASVPILTNGACSGATVTQSISPGTSITSGQMNVVLTTIVNGSTSTCTVTMMVICTNGAPFAQITYPALVPKADSQDPYGDKPPIINDGILTVTGSVYQTGAAFSNAEYRIVIFTPIPGTLPADGDLVRDSGWFPPARIIGGVINTNDLTFLPNGVYDLVLFVRNGNGEEATNSVRFILDSNLKVGQFSFSQQDVVIPVSGIPITIIRTYNSLDATNFNAASSNDFGAAWTYALNDLHVELDEERDEFHNTDEDRWDSLRVGGGRDVTLTLPDGRRVTFAFRLKYDSQTDARYYAAEWQAPPGVPYKLEPKQTPAPRLKVPLIIGLPPFWEDASYSNGGANPEGHYDFPGFVLTAPDGTRYEIDRTDFDENHVGNNYGDPSFFAHPYGPPKLARIVLRDGSSLSFSTDGVTHSSGKSIRFHRDDVGRIDAIYDAKSLNESGTTGPPAVGYVYDNGNLVAVSNLVSRSPLTYNVTQYLYNGPPHYITEIKDARGISPIKNLYDAQGRLYAVVDAFGKTNSFSHDIANRREVITDRLGNQTIHVYDKRGNVVWTEDAVGSVTERTYDDNNNMLTESNVVGVTSYSYDESSNRTRIIDPLGHTNSFIYESLNGGHSPNMLTHTDALNRVTSYNYANGDLAATIDPAGNITSNVYSSAGNRTAEYQMSSDLTVLTATSYGYDLFGNLTSVTNALGHVTLYTYDDNGNQLTESTTTNVDGTGATLTTTHIYDGQNRIIETRDPLYDANTPTLHCTKTVYNAIGKQDQTIDKMGRTTWYEYDDMGRLTKVTYPDYTFETYGYDAEGRRTTTIDRGNQATTSTYDPVGRQILTIYPDGATVSNTYDTVGRLVATIDARTNTTTYVYDAAGRRTTITNAVGTAVQQVTKFDYDPAGNLLKTTDALGHSVSNVYDRLDRVTNVVYLADNSTQRTIYDILGRRVAAIDQAGVTNQFGYDVLGRLTAVTNALNKVTRYEYDALGNLLRQIDANNHTNRFVYDKLGRRLQRYLPAGQGESFVYDGNGNQTSHTDFNGHTTLFEYDAMNRLTRKTPDIALQESPVLFTYTATGQRSTMVDDVGTTTFTYDSRDRLKSKATSIGILNYDYDFNGNVTKIQSSTPNGTSVTYQYDALNRVANVIDARLTGNQTTRYGYDAVGNLLTNIYPNAVTNLCLYDSLNRLTNLTAKVGTSPLGSFAYLVGAVGNRTNLNESVNGTTRSYTWRYDPLYRLTNEVISASPAGAISYKYDSVGNRTNRTSNVTGISSGDSTYNVNDQLMTDSYDANGNTTTNSAGNPYRYDFENRLTNYKNRGAVYVYDGDGNRVGMEVGATTTIYLVDDKNPTGYAQVLEELISNGGTTNLSRSYTYGQDLISQRQVSNGMVSFYGYDGHGSTRFLTTANGTITDTYTYDVYGSLIASNVATANVYLYCGEQYDPNLGFYYLRARYLNPASGRFWTRDTVEGNSEDPLSLHKYLYVQDNPVDNVDPSGNDIEEALAGLDIGGILDQNRPLSIVRGINSFLVATVDVHFDRLGSKFGISWHHAYLLLHEIGKPTIGFRGGPSTPGGTGYLTEAGSGRVFFPGNFPDYPSEPEHDVAHVSVSGPLKTYDQLRQGLQQVADHIESLHAPYHAIKGPNSNSFAKTLIVKNGLTAPTPPVWAPGWDDFIY